VQDAENLAWKLAFVLRGDAPEALIDSYGIEREAAADENILNSTRSTDFITPKNAASLDFRNAALSLAKDCPFARRIVNSGRLSLPSTYRDMPLGTPDADSFAGVMIPGAPAADAPLLIGGEPTWLLRRLRPGFTALHYADSADDETLAPLAGDAIPIAPLVVTPAMDAEGRLAARYDLRPGTTYLLRPDQHVAARFRRPDPAALRAARDRACGLVQGTP
jgi:3-(3-hydroxy-phenyl)propionate hydroxylase